jgi:hypothetical protein
MFPFYALLLVAHSCSHAHKTKQGLVGFFLTQEGLQVHLKKDLKEIGQYKLVLDFCKEDP